MSMTDPTVKFRQMKDGDQADYDLLADLEHAFVAALPERILGALRQLEHSLAGYRISRLDHSLQAATRAEADGADEEYIVAALIHDLGDDLAPLNHSQLAASIIRPYVRPEVTWVIYQHGLFQNFYYAHFYGGQRDERERYRNHPWYQACVDFCERWDQNSFDPDYATQPLEYFEPMVRRIFGRRAFDPAVVGSTRMSSPLEASPA
jgi:predicted HD phosphohydrolase